MRQVRNLKIIFTNVISILKVNETIVPKCFQIFSCCTVLPHSYATPSYTIFTATLFWIGSKKIELSYFLTPSYDICSFFPPVKLFIAHMTRYSVDRQWRLESIHTLLLSWSIPLDLSRSIPFWVDPHPFEKKGLDRLKTSLTVHTVCIYHKTKIPVSPGYSF